MNNYLKSISKSRKTAVVLYKGDKTKLPVRNLQIHDLITIECGNIDKYLCVVVDVLSEDRAKVKPVFFGNSYDSGYTPVTKFSTELELTEPVKLITL